MPKKDLKINNLKCEYRINPLGIDVLIPRLSWQLSSSNRGTYQRAYQVIAAPDEESLGQVDSALWDSGKVESDQSIQIPYAGPALQSRQRVHWRVRVWDENDQPTNWSVPAWFEMGLLNDADWQAEWIGYPLVGGPRTPVPSPHFRKEFSTEAAISSARLYITSLGLYQAFINGQRVGEDVFAPGWTDYKKRIQYQVYDVTTLLGRGPNALAAVLGDGWYCGNVEWRGRQHYGDRPKLLGQLEIAFADGSKQFVATDETWQTAVGPLLEADLIMGEAYDARLELEGWSCASLQTSESSAWIPALSFTHPQGTSLVAQNTPTVRTQAEIAPISDPIKVWSWPKHKWIYDFGQNLVGRVRLRVKGKRGTTITLRFGEVLDEKEGLYTDNLRTARQIDYYTLKGDPDGEVWESSFTFHGFRYVELAGLPQKPPPDVLTAVVLHSENPRAIKFECSEPLINQLQHNIEWGWKGNSIDVPTDCPQRDERLGWTGDGQVFVKTATYLTDLASFFTKWIQDLADAQLESGAIPAIAPVTEMLNKTDGGPAWSDAFIIVPWTVWQQYGDTRIIEKHYQSMSSYVDYLVENSPGLIRLLPNEEELGEENEDWQIGGYGDWLAQDGNTDRRGLMPKDLIGTAFLAYDARLMAQMAEAIGKSDDAEKFNQLYKDTRIAFIQHFITPDGLMVGQTQTGYILALYFDLVPKSQRPQIIAALIKDIDVTRKLHMSTGFVGTPYICQVLTDVGRVDLAYTLLLQKTFPSWLFSVIHGATTIWERWDSWTPENGFQDPGMNSFNHYAYGAVGTWMYENITGIKPDLAHPGFKHFTLQPKIGGDLTYARCEYQSPYGLIKSHWRSEGESLIWDITVPPNTTATARIPADDNAQIMEGDGPFEDSSDVVTHQRTEEEASFELLSGSYQIVIRK